MVRTYVGVTWLADDSVGTAVETRAGGVTEVGTLPAREWFAAAGRARGRVGVTRRAGRRGGALRIGGGAHAVSGFTRPVACGSPPRRASRLGPRTVPAKVAYPIAIASVAAAATATASGRPERSCRTTRWLSRRGKRSARRDHRGPSAWLSPPRRAGDAGRGGAVPEGTGCSAGCGACMTSWIAADPSPQKSAAPSGAQGLRSTTSARPPASGASAVADGPNGTSSSRGPSQSRGKRTTLSSARSCLVCPSSSSEFTGFQPFRAVDGRCRPLYAV